MPIHGTDDDDTLAGTTAGDTMSGRSGADLIDADDGNDVVGGGNGSDTIIGGAGNDLLYGFGKADLDPANGLVLATRVATGLAAPVFLGTAPGDGTHAYVLEKNAGVIRRLDPATGTSTVFLDIGATIAFFGEQGLLGLAFHPDYATNGRLFVFVNNLAGDIELREYTASPGASPPVADPASQRLILSIPHPGATNHNGGSIHFGPDGNLYISVGDGGGPNDQNGDAQNLDVLLGKILRIDVDGDDFPDDPNRNYALPPDNPFVGTAGADEIFAYGLRNPWRTSFDPSTGDFYVGDVGQGAREEISLIPAGTSGQNFGWRWREGTIDSPAYTPPPGFTSIDPIFDYGRALGRSVTGGLVNRGPAPGLEGAYLFADFALGTVFTLRYVNGRAVDALNITDRLVADVGSVTRVTSFGIGPDGHIYVVTFTGDVYRLVPDVAAGDGNDSIDAGAGNDRAYGGVGDDTLLGGDGNDTLDGGLGNDSLTGDAGNDRLAGGAGNDTLAGGEGNDIYIVDGTGDTIAEGIGGGIDRVQSSVTVSALAAETEHLFLAGAAAIDATGNALGNDIRGNGANNVLDGLLGNDRVTGGAGNDTFRFSTTPGIGNLDMIRDFVVAEDTIALSRAVFPALPAGGTLDPAAFHIGARASEAAHRIIYDEARGFLVYDANGSTAGGAVRFAVIGRNLALAADDFAIV